MHLLFLKSPLLYLFKTNNFNNVLSCTQSIVLWSFYLHILSRIWEDLHLWTWNLDLRKSKPGYSTKAFLKCKKPLLACLILLLKLHQNAVLKCLFYHMNEFNILLLITFISSINSLWICVGRSRVLGCSMERCCWEWNRMKSEQYVLRKEVESSSNCRASDLALQ